MKTGSEMGVLTYAYKNEKKAAQTRPRFEVYRDRFGELQFRVKKESANERKCL